MLCLNLEAITPFKVKLPFAFKGVPVATTDGNLKAWSVDWITLTLDSSTPSMLITTPLSKVKPYGNVTAIVDSVLAVKKVALLRFKW